MKRPLASPDQERLRRTNPELITLKVRNLSENPAPYRRGKTIRNRPFIREEALKISLSKIRAKLNLAAAVQRNDAPSNKRFKRPQHRRKRERRDIPSLCCMPPTHESEGNSTSSDPVP